MKRTRNGKYHEYEKTLLQFLIKQNDLVTSGYIKRKLRMSNLKIPKSSLYDVLGTLRDNGHIEWIGEPQDWISEIGITEKGKDYLKSLTHSEELS